MDSEETLKYLQQKYPEDLNENYRCYWWCTSNIDGSALTYYIDLQYLHELWDKQKGLCALSGMPMTYYFDSGRVPTNLSVDRIDSSLGYIKGNIQLVCMAVNQMKSDLTVEQLKYFCKSILEYKKQ